MDGDTIFFFAWLAAVVAIFANYSIHEIKR